MDFILYLVAAAVGGVIAWIAKGSNKTEVAALQETPNKSKKVDPEKAFSKLEKAHNVLSNKANKLGKEKQTLTNEISGLQSELAKVTETVAPFETSIAKLEKDKAALDKQVEFYKGELSLVRKEMIEKEQTLTESSSKNDTVHKELAKLRELLSAARAEKDGMMPKMNEYREKYENANLERNILKSKYEMTVKTGTNYADQIKATNLAAQESQELAAHTQAQLTSAEQNIEQLQSALKAEKAINEQTQSDLQKTLSKNTDIQLRYESLLRNQERNLEEAKS